MNLLRHSGAALLAALAVPSGALALAIRSDWRENLSERLGSRAESPKRGVWLHGASMGEAAIMARLHPGLDAMGLPVTASLFTPTGCRRFRELVPGADCSLAPLDHPWVVDRVLSSLDPIALVLVETELWPFLISAASLRDVPIAVLSGRLSDRSFENYRRALPFFSPRLARIDRIGARSELDAERFLALGARPECVEVTGDLKLEPLEPSAGSPPDWDAILGGCMAFVAGSTHEGEEVAALEALYRCEREGLAVGLVLAPRHLTRVENVIEAVKRAGRTPRLRSQIGTSTLQAGRFWFWTR